jgi:hypothetical protein
LGTAQRSGRGPRTVNIPDDEEASVIFLKLCAAGLKAWIE